MERLNELIKELEEAHEELGYDLDNQFGDDWGVEKYAELGDVIRELKEFARTI